MDKRYLTVQTVTLIPGSTEDDSLFTVVPQGEPSWRAIGWIAQERNGTFMLSSWAQGNYQYVMDLPNIMTALHRLVTEYGLFDYSLN